MPTVKIDPNDVRSHAKKDKKKQEGGGNFQCLNSSDALMFVPKKEGQYIFDIIPYTISADNHPEKSKGDLWWKRDYYAHRNIGVDDAVITCPTTFGQRCAICDENKRYWKEGDGDSAKPLKKKNRFLLNIRLVSCPKSDSDNQPNQGKYMVYDGSAFLFLDKFITEFTSQTDEAGSERHANFIASFPNTETGCSIVCRYVEKDFEGNKFYQADRIDFVKREKALPKNVLSKVEDLDKLLKHFQPKEVSAMFFGGEEIEQEEDIPNEDVVVPNEDDPPFEDDATQEDPEPSEEAFSVGDRVIGTIEGDEYTGEVKEITEDGGITISFDDGDEQTLEESDVRFDALIVEDDDIQEEEPESTCPFEAGQKVKARYEDGEFYDGTIDSVQEEDETVKVIFDDGDEATVSYDDIQSFGSPASSSDDQPNNDDNEMECPGGGTFGVDTDNFNECEECMVWSECLTKKNE